MKFSRLAVLFVMLAAFIYPLIVNAADEVADGKRVGPQSSGTGAQPSSRPPSTVMVGGIYRSDTTARTLTLDGSGNLQTSEAFKDRDQFLNQVAISDTESVLNGCDSTQSAIYTAPYGRLFLHIKVAQTAATGGFANLTWVRLAIEVRGGYTSLMDTTSMVPWMGATQAASSDSLRFGTATGVGSSSTGQSNEMVVTIPFTDNQASKWGSPHGSYVELTNARGLPFWAPYTFVRCRLIETSAVTTTTIPPYVSLTIRLIGRPL